MVVVISCSFFSFAACPSSDYTLRAITPERIERWGDFYLIIGNGFFHPSRDGETTS